MFLFIVAMYYQVVSHTTRHLNVSQCLSVVDFLLTVNPAPSATGRILTAACCFQSLVGLYLSKPSSLEYIYFDFQALTSVKISSTEVVGF